MKFKFSNGFEYGLSGRAVEKIAVINFSQKCLDIERTAVALIRQLNKELPKIESRVPSKVTENHIKEVTELYNHVKLDTLKDIEVEITDYDLEIRPEDKFIYYYIDKYLIACSLLNNPHEYTRRLIKPTEEKLKESLIRSMNNFK